MTLKEHVQAPHRRNPTAERDKNGFGIDLHSYGKSNFKIC